MKVIYGLAKIKKFKKPVVALGVFDGVHRGHIRILKATVEKARAIKGTSMVLTFWPHPQREESLYSLEHRLRLISELGVEVSIVINFSRKFALVSAEDFIKDILLRKIRASFVFVGENFRFGKDARGDCRILKRLSEIYPFKLKLFKVIRIRNKPVSSTSIRSLIKKGDLIAAQNLLTRPVSVLGTVIKGASVARGLGFATANINPHHEVLPPAGVYAVKVFLNKRKLSGICNIGTKPTFAAQNACLSSGRHSAQHIETHVFNFKENIYGKYLEIQFLKKIRNERKFASLCALAGRVKKDITYAKALFSLP